MKSATEKAFTLFVFFLASTNVGDTKAENTTNGYKYEQDGIIWGRHTALVTNSAFKVIDRSSNVDYIGRAPDWNLLIVNHRNKKFLEVEPSKFKGAPQGRMTLLIGDNILRRKFKKCGTENIAGVETTKFSIPLSAALHLDEALQKTALAGKPSYRTMDFYVENAFPLPPKAFPALSKLYGVNIEGLPLKICWTKENGYPGIAVRTSDAKKVHIEKMEFLPPVGYKQAKDLAETIEDDAESLFKP